jgi:hypothetical protein
METPPRAANGRHGRLLAEIEAARAQTSAESSAILGAGLDAAAHAPKREETDGLDAAVLEVLRDASHRDRILERLDLDALALLAERVAARSDREPAWDLLDLLRRPVILRRIDAANDVEAWAARILRLIDASHLTMATLLRRRAEEYGAKVLFEIPTPANPGASPGGKRPRGSTRWHAA